MKLAEATIREKYTSVSSKSIVLKPIDNKQQLEDLKPYITHTLKENHLHMLRTEDTKKSHGVYFIPDPKYGDYESLYDHSVSM